MSGTPRAGSYRDVLLLPYALRTFAPALLGRLSYGLLPLSTLFTVHQATGAFATAGLAVALFGLASLSMPYKSRLVDRYSQRRVLPILAVLSSAALAATAVVSAASGTPQFRTASAAVLVVLVCIAGVFAPPLGPSMRSTWRHLTQGTDLKERAYALDAICEESLYLGGPLLAGVLISLWSASGALAVTACLMLVGTLLMTMTLPARRTSPPPPTAQHALGPLHNADLRRVLLVILVVAAGVSVAYICLAGVAQRQGRPGATGYLEAGIGLGSVIGGFLWARRNHTRSRSIHVSGLIVLMAVGMFAAAFTTNLVLLGLVMAVAGLAVAPLFVVSYLAADDLTAPHQRTEASTWINTMNNLGSSAGSALAGLTLDRAGPGRGFLAAGGLLAVTAVLVALGRRLDAPESSQPRPTGDGR